MVAARFGYPYRRQRAALLLWRMSFISGLLNLGTGLVGNVVVTPPSGTNYAPLPISYELVNDGVALNTVNAVFGPVSGTWNTLVAFGVSDENDNPVWAGTLLQPITPVNGQLVVVPTGYLNLTLGAPAVGIPLLNPHSLAGNTLSVSGGAGSISLDPSLVFTSGGALAVSSSGTVISGLLAIAAAAPLDPVSGGGPMIWLNGNASGGALMAYLGP